MSSVAHGHGATAGVVLRGSGLPSASRGCAFLSLATRSFQNWLSVMLHIGPLDMFGEWLGVEHGLRRRGCLCCRSAFSSTLIRSRRSHSVAPCFLQLGRAETNARSIGMDVELLALVRAGGDDAEAVQRLLSAGASCEAVDEQGWTAIIRAAQAGNSAILAILGRALIDAGSNCDAPNPAGGTALAQAAASGKADCVQLLLFEFGADVNAR
eukprot:COSAG06_NODE_263_length_18879_cov_71.911555_17_plen_211_part_00